MRVVHENKPDHPDNHAYVVSHVGLNNDDHWEDFRELDFDDQRMIHEWIAQEANDDASGIGDGRPRRFDQGMLVDDEIIGEFISKSFLDLEDDRVLDEFLNREIGGGITLADLMSRDELRDRLRKRQKAAPEQFVAAPVQPQRRRVQARKRLSERSRSVSARVLQDLGLTPMGREVGQAIKTVRGRDNRSAMIELMNRHVNEHLGIDRAQRGKITAQQAEDALEALDALGDEVVREVESPTERNRAESS